MKPQLILVAFFLMAFSADRESLKVFQTDSAHSSMTIEGTSTLHDWEMKAMDLQGTVDATLSQETLSLRELKLWVPVEALRSGKKAMDNNAYKALKRKEYPHIKYQLLSVSDLQRLRPGLFQLNTKGKLEVAGKTRLLDIPIRAQVLDQGIEFSGSTTFLMSSFDVEAPQFMMGAVSTGDEITINFKIRYN